MRRIIIVFSLGVLFSGSFIGAGFVSGQELWQFFGFFGWTGIIGMTIAFTILFFVSFMIFDLVSTHGVDRITQLISFSKKNTFNELFGLIQIIFVVGTVTIMAAGVGALGSQSFNLNPAVGSLSLCIIVWLLSANCLKNMLRLFKFLIPFLILITIILSFKSFSVSTVPIDSTSLINKSPLLKNIVISSILYLGNALFSSIGALLAIFKDFSMKFSNKKNFTIALILGSLFLFLIGSTILIPLIKFPFYATYEIPVTKLAFTIHPILGNIYSLLMALAMLGAALTGMMATTYYIKQRSVLFSSHCRIASFILVLIIWMFSFIGFGKLIGYIYPLGGFFGIISIFGITHKFISLKCEAEYSSKKSDI